MTFIYAFAFILLSIMGCVLKKSKLISILILILVIILFGWNTENPDYENYLLKYNSAAADILTSGDIGFGALCLLGNKLGLSFVEFKILLGILVYVFFYKIISRNTQYIAIVWTLYILNFFFLDVTQIRNFISFIIVALALDKFLASNGNFSDIIKYSFTVILASSIHISSIFFLLFLLAHSKNLKWCIIVLLSIIVAILQHYLYDLLTGLQNKYNDYENTISLIAAICYSIVLILNYLYVKYICAKHTDNLQNKTQVLLTCNMLLICLFPLYFDNATFSRLQRYMAILNIIYLSDLIFNKGTRRERVSLYLYCFYYALMFIWSAQGVVSPVFNSNCFIK